MKVPHYPGLPAAMPAYARSVVVALIASVCLMLAACGGGNRRADAPAARDWPQVRPAKPGEANAVLMRAIGLVGTPYRYGGNTPESGFDCSGLVTYVYRDMLDLRLPRSSRELAEIQGPRIAPERLATADLVFFRQPRECFARRHLCGRRPLRACAEHRRNGAPRPAGRPLLARQLFRSSTRS
jgi:hypothetical protein